MKDWLKQAVRLEPLRHLPQHLSQWVPNLGRGVTVLLIDNRWLKLLHASGWQTTQTITTLLAHPIEGMSDEDVLAWLKQACAARAFEAGPVLIANPSHLTTTRLFTLPSVDPVEIRDIVELQAEKHTPYAKEEILIDFRIVDTDHAGYSRVLLILSHQDIVHRGLKLVEGMGWSLERVGFELEGLITWAGRVDQDTAHQPRLIVELDSDTSTLIILQEEKLFFHRSIAFGVRQVLSDPANGTAKFLSELQRSVESLEAEGANLTIAKVILTGQAERIEGLSSRVKEKLNIPATIISPFEQCALADSAMAREDTVSQVAMSSLVGLVLGPSQVNLTPSALKLHRAFEDRAKALVGLGCQVMGVLLLICCLIMGTAHQDERYHAELLQEFAIVSRRTQQLDGLMEQMTLVKQWLQHRGELLDAVEELSQRSPPVIQWDNVTFTQGEQLTLRGVSEDMPKVFDFSTALRAVPFCNQVDAKRVTKKKTGEQDLTEFEIVCTMGAASS